MPKPPTIENQVRARRLASGWSQQELALRSGLSRTGIGAIESGRLVPSTAAALALAESLGCKVDELFRIRRDEPEAPAWAWAPKARAGRFWEAEVGGCLRLYPAEASPLGVIPHDGTFEDGVLTRPGRAEPSRTLVMACCDPAVGLLASELARSAGVRLIAPGRSSRDALEMLRAGVVHVAGLHLARSGDDDGHASLVREALGPGHTLLRVATWEEGIACSPARKLSSVAGAVRSDLRWVGREAGSGARRCLDEVLDGRRPPRRSASDHRGVAEAVRSGWADAGICLRLAAEEAELDFLGVRQECYDLCFPTASEGDPRLRGLLAAVQSPAYRGAVGDLPGYDVAESGSIRRVD